MYESDKFSTVEGCTLEMPQCREQEQNDAHDTIPKHAFSHCHEIYTGILSRLDLICGMSLGNICAFSSLLQPVMNRHINTTS